MVVHTLHYSSGTSQSSLPQTPCLIIGHLQLLRNFVTPDNLKAKFGNVISPELFKDAVARLNPGKLADQ